MAEQAGEMVRFRDDASGIGWPLESIWLTGELLETTGDVEVGSVILSIDAPADDLPWLATDPAGEWVGDRLRLGKRPMLWCYRPHVWPAWNARHRRVLRYWMAEGGLDESVIASLRGDGPLASVDPTDEHYREQLIEEQRASRRHLEHIVDNYWERDWRRDHKGQQAEDALWRAASGLLEIEETLASLE